MNARLLIDGIVRQTTVLIAQLSTAAGVRSPLAHVADQVFLSLAQEIERAGVGRKVVADMFGLALRTYQRKVQRLEESTSVRGRTLWEAVLGFIGDEGPVHRERVLEKFERDDQLAVTAVLNDLITSGLVYCSGRAEAAVYGVTSDADRRELGREDTLEVLSTLLWGAVFRQPGTTTRALLRECREPEHAVRAALERLLADGRVSRDEADDDAPLRSSAFTIPPGATVGWEAAALDHFQAAARAIAERAVARAAGDVGTIRSGGTTLHFGIRPGHPYEAQVLGLLARVRGELDQLWQKVAQHNREHPAPDDEATRVTFYFGQSVIVPGDRRSAGPDDEGDTRVP